LDGRWRRSYKLQKIRRRGKRVRTGGSGRGASGRGAEVQHPEESVLVDFGSVKSQKNM